MADHAYDFRKTRDRLLAIEGAIREKGVAGEKMWLDAFNALLSELAHDRNANPSPRTQTELERQSQLTKDLKKIDRTQKQDP